MRTNSITRLINPKVHGVLDYVVVALLLVAPSLFDWTGTIRNACYAVGIVQFAMSLLTAYPLGLVRMLPFTVHATLEFAVAIALIALPWMAGFDTAPTARNFFVAMGIGLLALWALTDYRQAERKPVAVPDKVVRRAEELKR